MDIFCFCNKKRDIMDMCWGGEEVCEVNIHLLSY